MIRDEDGRFRLIQDNGDSVFYCCNHCGDEFWTDCTGENCVMDYIDRTLDPCCPGCGSTNARLTPANLLDTHSLLEEMRRLARKNASTVRYARFAKLFLVFDETVKTMNFLKKETLNELD